MIEIFIVVGLIALAILLGAGISAMFVLMRKMTWDEVGD